MVYHRFKTKKGALAGMAVGTGVMTVFGSLFNAVYLLPTFAELYGMPLEAIVGIGAEVTDWSTAYPPWCCLRWCRLTLSRVSSFPY